MALSRIGNHARAFVSDERGVSAVEYGLIAAGIFVAISAIVYQFGGTLETTYESVNDAASK